ncbi:hypothetical protein JM946_06280 [Steroidobacter sp. S1-65]|uniref:Uncharacterized protein n=1 Tax=Steroidobacter gossypii TaxID=2805490 RepID=A0ABS1WTP2_9GAMM|nr:right-handed parallel beta-helix repeat-containing protein [Steroidobacter gossypii]MBM0104343.1 hypothetical protein [Steroidobacter gossypii]
MQRRDLSKILIASAAGSALLSAEAKAQTCTPACYPRTQSEIDAMVVPTDLSYPPGDVRRYGAVAYQGPPAAITNQTVAFNRAIAAHPAEVSVPAGEFYVNLTITTYGVQIRGMGREQTTLRNFANAAIITIDNSVSDIRGFVLEGVYLRNRDKNSYTSADGIHVRGVSAERLCDFLSFKDVYIFQMRHGIHLEGRTIWNTFDRVVAVESIENGLYLNGTNNCSVQKFVNCRFAANGQNGVLVNHAFSDLATAWSFDTCNFELNLKNAIRITGTHGIQSWSFTNCYLEENASALASGSLAPRKSHVFIDCEYAMGVQFQACTMYGNAGLVGPDWAIYVDAGVQFVGGSVQDCRFGVTAQGAIHWPKNCLIGANHYETGTLSFRRTQGSVDLRELGLVHSWTPTIAFGGYAGALAYTNQSGCYSIHGGVLNATCYVSMSGKTSAVGQARIVGLPLAARSSIPNLIVTAALSGDGFAVGPGVQIVGRVHPGQSAIDLLKFENGTLSPLTDAEFGPFAALSVTVQYHLGD